MAITARDQYYGIQRIGRERFRQLAQERFAPAVLAERDPGEYWDECARWNVDTLFVAAIFGHESTFGRYGTATETHSWGNTRLPSFGYTPIGIAQGRSGEFPIYQNWLAGCGSTAARLASDRYYYRGERRTIGEVFNDPKRREPPIEWAPAGDLNDPAGYLADVLAFMNRYAETPVQRGGGMLSKPIVISAPSPNRWDPDPQRHVEALVWHITQGTDSLGWLRNPASQVSANYLVARNGVIYELVDPHTGSTWANGPMAQPNLNNPIIRRWFDQNLNPNHFTVSIEFEGFSSENKGGSLTPDQIEAGIRLSAWLCQEFQLPADETHILGHYEINGVDRPYCPGFSAAEWTDWIEATAATLASASSAPPSPPTPANDAQVASRSSARLRAAHERTRAYCQENGLPDPYGLPQVESWVDLHEIATSLPARVRCLVCEKGVLWTPEMMEGPVDTFHRGQYEALSNKQELR